MATILVAFCCLALVLTIESPAQSAPWDIEKIQLRLVDLGYDVGDVDGLMGPKTRSALRSFQADQGLPVTGLPDGTTQRALFAAEPAEPATDAPTPDDDPPSLEAVPLEPVRVAPLAPLAKGNPQKGFPVDLILAEQPAETRPSIRKDRDWTLSQEYLDAKSELQDKWIKWVAGTLAALGALLIFAAVSRKLASRKAIDAEQPQPTPAFTPRATTTSTATTTTPGAHVFGVDVPPSRDSGPQ